MNKLFSGNGPRITAIGGGTGLSVLLRGLKKISDNLAAVVTMADDGGSSGMIREDLGMLPPGDVRSCLLALADVESNFGDLMQYRFKDGILTGQNMGNLILAGLAKMAGSFEKGLEVAHDIFRIRGRVIPVTCQDVVLCARLTGGTIVRGESSIPRTVIAGEGRIDSVFLEPKDSETWEDAQKAIKYGEIIIIGPGSLYTSMIPNFLVGGINDTLADSKAIKIMICNVMTQKGETDGFGVKEHVSELLKYMGGVKPDYVLVNNLALTQGFLNKYSEEGASQVLMKPGEREEIEKIGVKVVEGDFIDIQLGYIRHDADAIAEIIMKIWNDSIN